MNKNILHKLSRVNINIINYKHIQNKTYLLKDVFKIYKKEKKIENKSVNKDANSIFKKLDKNYVDKMSLILHDSVSYKDYSFKRINLNKTIYKNIGNYRMRLTFKKFPKNKSQSKTDLSNNLNEIQKNYSNNFEDIKTFNANTNISALLYKNNKEKISFNAEKKIFNELKQKFLYYKPKLISQLNSPAFSSLKPPYLKKRIILSKIRLKNKNSSLNKNQSSSNLNPDNKNMNNIFQQCNSLKALRDKKILDKEVLNNKKIFYEKIKEELNPIKIKKTRKNNLMSSIDLFYYDPKKWNKYKNDKIKNKDKGIFDYLDKQFNENITFLKNRNEMYKDKLMKLNDFKNNKNYSYREICNYLE